MSRSQLKREAVQAGQSVPTAFCGLCGNPMPPGEEMFNYHGYSGDCPPAENPADYPSVDPAYSPQSKYDADHRAGADE